MKHHPTWSIEVFFKRDRAACQIYDKFTCWVLMDGAGVDGWCWVLMDGAVCMDGAGLLMYGAGN